MSGSEIILVKFPGIRNVNSFQFGIVFARWTEPNELIRIICHKLHVTSVYIYTNGTNCTNELIMIQKLYNNRYRRAT